MLPRKAERALEVGCGTGATLAWLREAGLADHTTGIEIAPAAAAIARSKLDHMYEGDADKILDTMLPQAHFDVVLCLDVLEHLVDPWSTVRRIRQVLRPGGHFVASVPNVRHATVVLPLLMRGRWQYTESGQLDKTHLRFFTRQSAMELISQPGLQIIQWRRRIYPWPSRTGWINILSAGLLSDFLTQNYIIHAVRTD